MTCPANFRAWLSRRRWVLAYWLEWKRAAAGERRQFLREAALCVCLAATRCFESRTHDEGGR